MTYKSYNPAEIEKKWQKVWEKSGIYEAKDFSDKKKFYLLVEFPYCSGAGLHIGHARPWLPTDALARKKRMDGYNVLFPMGWDAFGLPTENYAIKTGHPPAEITAENIAHFREQAKSLGLSFDWGREVDTSDPNYYKWTQWIFVQMFKKDLAYQAEVPVNWCPNCKTNLADEEVLGNGTHERCGAVAEKRLQKQWLLRITKYADRLIDDLKKVDYPNRVAVQQVNWIGKKEGINITYKVDGIDEKITVFTTAPVNFGMTFLVLAPEHEIVAKIVSGQINVPNENKLAVKKYVDQTKKKTDQDRIAEGKEKTGAFTGLYAINWINNKKVPVYVTDFVLGNVGTGAVQGCPAHDRKDWQFAKKFDLPIVRVVVGPDGYDRSVEKEDQIIEKGMPGTFVNSDFLNGLSFEDGLEKTMDYFEENGWGKRVKTYHLHDWIFSRQHYWGEPIPIIHCPKDGPVPVPEDQLPVKLPYLEKYQPTGTGESPLAQATDWLNTICPKCGGSAKRETDTMPNWAGSNWYFVRYLDPHNDHELASKKLMDYWLPVDVYEGGYEHTTLHLLYSRFIYKFLFDIGVVPSDEPYASRRVHGILLASDNQKMSKSKGNVVDPMEIVDKYGSDTLRLYEMFIGPFDQQVSWNDRSLAGCYRLCNRVFALQSKLGNDSSADLKNALSKTIDKVGADLDQLKFNTAVAAIMEFVNVCEAQKEIGRPEWQKFLMILAPMASHLAEELWSKDHKDSVHTQKWPEASVVSVEEAVTIVVSVNGKTRATLEFSALEAKVLDQERVELAAKKDENVAKHLEGKEIKRVIYVQNRIVNFVIE